MIRLGSYDIEIQEKAKKLRLIDDALFRLIAVRKEVCQEILRTLLDDDELEVVSVTPQETMVSLFRGITLDALCKLGDGTLSNIEMQKGSSNDDIRRVRFHASLITANYTPKGTDFKDIPEVKVLYITEYDALQNNQNVTHVSRCQKVGKEYIPIEDGEDIIFANTVVKKQDKYTKLLQLFLKSESFYEEEYPNLSKAMQHFKDTEKGRDKMCSIIEEYAVDIAVDTLIDACMDLECSKDKTIKMALKKFPQIPEEQIHKRVEELWNRQD